MDLIDSPQKIIIHKVKNLADLNLEEIKSIGHIEIEPTRMENLMIDIIYPATTHPPKHFKIYFFDSELQSSSTHSYSPDWLKPLRFQDKETAGFRIMNTGLGREIRKPDLMVKFIILHLENEDEKFECYINVKKKFTYQIHSKKIKEEFWFEPDGMKRHEKGEMIFYSDDIMLFVMEIDDEKWIARCGTLSINN